MRCPFSCFSPTGTTSRTGDKLKKVQEEGKTMDKNEERRVRTEIRSLRYMEGLLKDIARTDETDRRKAGQPPVYGSS